MKNSNRKLILLFNHELTGDQRDDIHKSLGVTDIVDPPEKIREIWRQIPADSEDIVSILAGVRKWLKQTGSENDFVLIQGDFGAVHLLVEYAMVSGLIPIYATTKREAMERHGRDGEVRTTHIFRHVRFRRFVNPYALRPSRVAVESVSKELFTGKSSPADDRLEVIFSELKKYGSWGQGGEERVAELCREIRERYPDSLSEFNKVLGSAKRAGGIINDCRKLGRAGLQSKAANKMARKHNLDLNRTKVEELLEMLKKELRETGFAGLCYKADNSFAGGRTAAKRYKEEREILKSGARKQTVRPRPQRVAMPGSPLIEKIPVPRGRPLPVPVGVLHANDIRGLQPCSRWELLLDETGSDFEESVQVCLDTKADLGRMVGLLIPAEGKPLPSLPKKGWHATEVKDPQ